MSGSFKRPGAVTEIDLQVLIKKRNKKKQFAVTVIEGGPSFLFHRLCTEISELYTLEQRLNLSPILKA